VSYEEEDTCLRHGLPAIPGGKHTGIEPDPAHVEEEEREREREREKYIDNQIDD
jgi:hypothetical protein